MYLQLIQATANNGVNTIKYIPFNPDDDLTLKKYGFLTISHLEVVLWRVKSSDVGQSKITKNVVLAGLGEKGQRAVLAAVQEGKG